MSTQIHNGWKFPEGTTLEQVFAQFREQGNLMRQMADDSARDRIIGRACGIIDKAMAHCMGLDEKENFDLLEEGASPLGHAFNKMLDLRYEKNSSEANHVSCEASVVVAAHRTGLYALTFFRNRDMEKSFVANMGLEQWGYWNNSDAPEGVSDAQWSEREKLWDDLVGDDAMCYAGATFEMVRNDGFSPWMAGVEVSDPVPNMPMDKRVWRIATDAPQSGLHKAKGTGEAHRMLVELRDNPPEDFKALSQSIHNTLLDPIPGAWLRMKRAELLAACQERVLQINSPSATGSKAGPRM